MTSRETCFLLLLLLFSSKWCTVLKMLARLFGTRQVKSLENSKDKPLTKKKIEKPRHKEFLTTLTGFGRRREK